uniref:Myristoylated alanine-rich C-kinase substrate n=1 Tax=Oncorhynchus tshawytscha TaxID=74940 RepID=A0A8C8HJX4_ONCTS
MGAQFSKTAAKGETTVEKPGEAAASPTKTNGQENGHVKVNGDASPAAAEAGKDEVHANGSATAEEAPKAEAATAEAAPSAAAVEGEKAENAEAVSPAAEGEAAKPEEGATPSTSNETPKKKKKRFSFKKSFKLSGFSFKKTKKETGDGAEGEEAAASTDEAKDEAAEAPEATAEGEAKTAEGEAKPAGAGEEAKEAASPTEAKPEETAAAPAEEAKAAAAEEPKAEEKPVLSKAGKREEQNGRNKKNKKIIKKTFPCLYVGVVPVPGFGELVYNQGYFKAFLFLFSLPPPQNPSWSIVTTIPTGRGGLLRNVILQEKKCIHTLPYIFFASVLHVFFLLHFYTKCTLSKCMDMPMVWRRWGM